MILPLRDRKGVAGVFFAFAMPLVLGFTALGTEVGSWFLDKRALQTAADMAAVSAAYELLANSGEENEAAEREAVRHGFDAAAGTMTVNNPPRQGAATGDADAVEVVLTLNRKPLFSVLYDDNAVGITARGTARMNTDGGAACVLALDPSAQAAVSVTGSVILNAPECVLAANSSHARAMTFTGSIIADLYSIHTVGSYRSVGSVSIDTAVAPKTGAKPVSDPYADRPMPPSGACDFTDFKKTGSTIATVTPGRYCGGIDVSGSSIINFAPGTYIMDQGSFKFTGSTKITCTACVGDAGVTVILTGSGSKYATVSIAGSVQVSLKAPRTGTYAGMLFMQDAAAPANGSNTITGSSSMSLRGALYFPNQTLAYAGSTASSAACTQIVARIVSFTGSAAIGADCDDTGVETINVDSSVLLVE